MEYDLWLFSTLELIQYKTRKHIFIHISNVTISIIRKVRLDIISYRQIIRQADRQADRQTDKQTDRQTDKQTNKQTDT